MLVLHFRFPYEGCFKGTLFKTYLGLLPPALPPGSDIPSLMMIQ